jgi:four helix bundle protein
MHKLEDLLIWQKAIVLVEEVYVATADFPQEEKYGLISQIRRCAVSIPSNIAEGAGRNSQKEFKQFLAISNGSSYELQTQLILAGKFKYINKKQLNNLITKIVEIQKMNYSFQMKLK